MFLQISQNSQENNRARVSLLIKLQTPASACNFISKETLAQVLSCEFYEISKNTFLHKTHLLATSVHTVTELKKVISIKVIIHLVRTQNLSNFLFIISKNFAYVRNDIASKFYF